MMKLVKRYFKKFNPVKIQKNNVTQNLKNVK